MGKKNLTRIAIILCGLIPLLALGTVSTINSNGTTLNSTPLSICEDSYEPNDTSGTAYTVSRSTTSILYLEQEDDDWFKIYLYAGESLDVDIYFTDALGDIDVKLYNPSLTQIDSSSSTSDNEDVSATSVSTTGYYYIEVYGFGGGINTGYYSMSFSITSCSITVTTPSSATSWVRGSSEYIYWTSSGCSSYVTIELYKDDYYYMTIISSTYNDGSYYWSIPSSLPTGSYYEVKIEDYYDYTDYDYSSYFTITSPGVPGFTWGFILLGIIMLLSMMKILLRKQRNSPLISP